MTGKMRTAVAAGRAANPVLIRATISPRSQNFFIIFVDAIFTTLFERLFTKVFDVTGANPSSCCVYLACHAD